MSRDFIEYGLGWSWTPGRVVKHIRDPDTAVIKVTNDNQLLGFAVMHFGLDIAHLNLLAVKPAYRRQGLGKRLMAWLQNTDRNAGIETIILEFRSTNHSARGFYKQIGYREFQAIAGYYQGKESAIRMRKTLYDKFQLNQTTVVLPWEKWQDS